jgi:hypothetical protein
MSDTDNASILSNAAALLERSRNELQATDIELAMLQAKRDVLIEVVSALSGRPRTRRSRTPRSVEPTGEPTDAIDAFADAVA